MEQYPQFIADQLYYSMHSELSQQDQTQAMLQNLKQVFALTTRHYQQQSDLIRAVLEAGRQIFDLETGIVSQIEDDQYTVLDVISPLEGLAPGAVFEVEGTYCREVVRSKEVLGFPHVGELLFMEDHPVYQNMKLEAYLSAPIWMDNRIVGTLNFTSKSPRRAGFSQHERDLITLMANAIATFMLVRDRETRLTQANHRLKKFVGYVAHDLRNPLGGILAMAKLVSKPSTSNERLKEGLGRIQNLAANALDFVHSILELSALGAGKIEPLIESIALLPIIQSVEEDLEELRKLKNCQLIIFCDENLSVQADPGLLNQVLTNLLSNALKYTSDRSEVVISAKQDESVCRIALRNPKEVSQTPMNDDARYRSYGFGLDIAEELLLAHRSELELEDSSGWFKASFTLPLAK